MISRRDFLTGSSLTLLGAAAPFGSSSTARATADAGATGTVEAETRHGRIRGRRVGGVSSFKGVPYGASTAGRNRFMPPRLPARWSAVRDCLEYGPICPQLPAELAPEYLAMIHRDTQPGGMDENCLNLNLWSPGRRDGARRPVLVSLHGGGMTRGSANAPAYDGTQLALAHDVVVIGVNHRLGRLGYLQLEDAHRRFASAGVAGIMDLVAALEWVRDNAENFGGDPGNVMIFGQSGGGAKVSTLLATRAASGLFHRAAVQSGSLLRFTPREQATQQADSLVKALGLTQAGLDDLQSTPWQRLLDAQLPSGLLPATRPVLDGSYLTHHPFDPVAPDESATVPLMVSSTLEDESLWLSNFALTEAGLRETLEQRFPGRGQEVQSLYRHYYPDRPAFLIQAQAFTDAGLRRLALHQAELKASQGKGAIYVYEWDWPSPVLGGRYGAVHGLDVAATFNDGRPDLDMTRLAGQMSAAWAAYARLGNPACAELPSWPGYDVTTRATMVFGTPTRMVNDPRGEIRQFWQSTPPDDT